MMKTVGREILWKLPQQTTVVLYSLLGILLLLFACGISSRIRFYRRGRPEGEYRMDHPWDRTMDLFWIGFCQKRMFEKNPGGPIHIAIYASFIALFFVTCVVAVEHDLGVKLLDGHNLGLGGACIVTLYSTT